MFVILDMQGSAIGFIYDFSVQYAKGDLFGMELSGTLGSSLKSRIGSVFIASLILALISLYFMYPVPFNFKISLIIGALAMTFDFLVEYIGISRREWDYPSDSPSFKKVPLEVPLIFFNCGIVAAFIYTCFTSTQMREVMSTSIVGDLNAVQVILFGTGAFFTVQYIRGKVQCLIFGVLPMGIAFYIVYQEPWVLVVSILPMYVDYYLEKYLVKKRDLKYQKYDDVVSTNIAVSYFVTTFFIFGCVALFFFYFR